MMEKMSREDYQQTMSWVRDKAQSIGSSTTDTEVKDLAKCVEWLAYALNKGSN